ncbi:MAG: TIGR04283 family arsenosugar biosynthesis glycosyltransferase [Candidatus Tectomicrobia bacterium]|nr:TIGR04283 family arsenosugar biosynthesis glycosyltransferase [Candidatus Tectomicrobia bacterium]
MPAPPESPPAAISVIIPVLNEASILQESLRALPSDPNGGVEVIVVDGGSRDGTPERARPHRVLAAPRGRARQMNAGAKAARGEILLFLHADTRLPPRAFPLIRETLADPGCVGGAFRHRLDRQKGLYRLISFMSNLRARWLGVIYGDQGLFVRRSVFEALGGFREMEILEDGDLAHRMRKAGRVKLLHAPIVTSARRWEAMGAWRAIFWMWAIALGYLLGVPPSRLRRLYPDVR